MTKPHQAAGKSGKSIFLAGLVSLFSFATTFNPASAQTFIADSSIPMCPVTVKLVSDCHIHEKSVFLSLREKPVLGQRHASAEYQSWQRLYSAR